MTDSLIDLTDWPSMPAPWSSADAGEAWVWGDYVLLLQKDPQTVAQVLARHVEAFRQLPVAIRYPWAVTVFHRADRNPHGPSARPLLVATLEAVDDAATAPGSALGLGPDGEATAGAAGRSWVMMGLFSADSHANLGPYDGGLDRDSARRALFATVRQQLSLTGGPRRIGAFRDVHGHPDTGWPEWEEGGRGARLWPWAAGAATLLAWWLLR